MTRPLTMKDISDAAKLRNAGMTWGEIGAIYGKSEANMRLTVVKNAEVRIQPRRRLTGHEQFEMLARYQSGERGPVIASDYGVDPSYPGKLARRRGAHRQEGRP